MNAIVKPLILVEDLFRFSETVRLDSDEAKRYTGILEIVRQYNSLTGDRHGNPQKAVLKAGVEDQFWFIVRRFIDSSGFSVKRQGESYRRPAIHLRDDNTADIYCAERKILADPRVEYEARFAFLFATELKARCVLIPQGALSKCLVPQLVRMVWNLRNFTEGIELEPDNKPPFFRMTGGDMEISPLEAVHSFLMVAENLCQKLGPEKLESIRSLDDMKTRLLTSIPSDFRKRSGGAILESVINQTLDGAILDIVLSV